MRLPLILSALALANAASALPSWDWQLSGPFDLTVQVDVLDIDPDDLTAADLASLPEQVTVRICYLSIGTLEDWRADVPDFPQDVIGKTYGEWPDERFLDIRRLDLLLPLMTARFQDCRDKGFTAIEPDNLDIYGNDSGFEISEAQTVAYIAALAEIAHGMGLQIGQKNAGELTGRLVGTMDFAITENCLQDGWCHEMAAYAQAGKPIYGAEYFVAPEDMPALCAEAASAGISLIFKDYDLHAGGSRCDQN